MINVHGSGMPQSNPNLLDNWFFENPVNQQNQMIYAGRGNYCIDRWYRGHDDNAVLTLHDKYISMSGAANAEFVQQLEHLYFGRTVTISALLHGGTLAFATGKLPVIYDGGYLDTGIRVVLPDTNGAVLGLSYYSGWLRFNFVVPEGSEVNMVAAKLEFGPVSTLAYDAPPNFQQELAKCQRHFYISGTGTQGCQIKSSLHGSEWILSRVDFPVPMRIAPTVKIISMNGTENTISEWGSGVDTLTGKCFVNAATLNQNGFNGIRVDGGGADANANYAWQVIADANIY